MRIVFDTNVLFAAFVARAGLCARIVEESIAKHEVFISQYILSELQKCLRDKAKIDEASADHAIASLLAGVDVVVPTNITGSVVRDPNDTPILATALASRADILISGDNDLLVLGVFETIPILSPQQFFDRFIGTR